MPNPIFSTGTIAKIAEETTPGSGTFSTATTLDNLRAITGNSWTMSFSDVTALADTYIRRRPARLDKGTVSFTFTANDTAPATNQLTDFRSKLIGRKKYKITVDIQGTTAVFDDTSPLISFEGYLSSVGTPSVATDDNVLAYEVGFQVD
jgi:hypothetical protein